MTSPRRVSLRRSGGLVAVRPLEIEVDLGAGDADAKWLAERLAAVDIERLARAETAHGPAADTFRYELVVELEERAQTIVCDQQALPSELRPVVERLERRALAEARTRRQPR